MTSYPDIPEQYLKLLQILHLSLGFAIVPLSIMIPVLASSTMPSEDEYNMIQILSIVHAVVFVSSMLAASFVVPNMIQSKNQQLQLATNDQRDTAWAEWLEAYKTSHIVGLTLREGPAMLGMVTLLLASINGVLWEYPIFWLNCISSALFLLYIAISIPTAEKITAAART